MYGGNALEAIQAFPKNVNVAVAAATAVAGPKKARVEVWSVPGLACNTHVIHVENSIAQANMEFAFHAGSQESPIQHDCGLERGGSFGESCFPAAVFLSSPQLWKRATKRQA